MVIAKIDSFSNVCVVIRERAICPQLPGMKIHPPVLNQDQPLPSGGPIDDIYLPGIFGPIKVKVEPESTAEPVLEWERTFGGSDDDWAFSVQQTVDGGFILAGWTESFGAGNSDFCLIKVSPGDE